MTSTGTVKWFNNAKGYGFLLPTDGGGDVFVHYSAIVMDAYRTLKAGQRVAFDLVDGPKGRHAVDVRKIDTDATAPDPASQDPASGS